MARIRTIKPEFWTDESLTECSLSARLLFIGMWNFADDKGNMEHSAKQLKMKIFPADDIKTEPLLKELITHGLLIEYSVSDKNYLHIKGFKKHQVINRPSKTNIPEYNDSLRTHRTLSECSLTEGKGRERKGKEEKELIAQNLRIVEKNAAIEFAFEKFWNAGLVKKDRKRSISAFKTALKKHGGTPEDFSEMLEVDIQSRIRNGQFGIDKLHPSTYLNGQRWEDQQSKVDIPRYSEVTQHNIAALADLELK